jgi:hypothetical protein
MRRYNSGIRLVLIADLHVRSVYIIRSNPCAYVYL